MFNIIAFGEYVYVYSDSKSSTDFAIFQVKHYAICMHKVKRK